MTQKRAIVAAEDIRGVYNGSGGALLKGTLVKQDTSSPANDEAVDQATAVSDLVYGVLMQDLADGEWGDCQIKGKAVCIASAAIVRGVRLTAAASGRVVTAASTNQQTGLAITAAAAGGDETEVELTPGGFAMP